MFQTTALKKKEMKESLVRVKHLRDTLVGLEMQIGSIQQDLSIIDYNLAHLRRLERELVFNINFLKKEKIIAIAQEYKKSVLELKSVRKSIVKYVNDEIRISAKLERYIKRYSEYEEEFLSAQRQLENEKVVLIFDLSKKKVNNEG